MVKIVKFNNKSSYIAQQYGRALIKKMTFQWKDRNLLDMISVYGVYWFWRLLWAIKKKLRLK